MSLFSREQRGSGQLGRNMGHFGNPALQDYAFKRDLFFYCCMSHGTKISPHPDAVPRRDSPRRRPGDGGGIWRVSPDRLS